MSDEQDPDIWEKFDHIEKDVASLMLRVSKMEEIVMRTQTIAQAYGEAPLLSAAGTKAQKTLPLQVREVTVAVLKDGDTNFTLNARISEISPVRTGLMKEGGGEWKNQTVRVGDYTGQIPVVLWGAEIDTYDTLMLGNYVTITGAYVKSYKEKPQLLLGKTGKIKLTEEHIL